MDQRKVGEFIAECRKKNKLTQMQLAEKLNITDRAISKWENGKSMPDSSIMIKLCDILNITVNDLLTGEKVTIDNYKNELENKLLEMVKQKEEADKRLLFLEIIIAILCIIILIILSIIAKFLIIEDWLRALLIIIGVIPCIVVTPFMIKVEQTAGYYECAKCGNRYVPTYKSVFMSSHIGTTRHMKCPKCNKKSWHKKVLRRE